MKALRTLRTKIFADGADITQIKKLAKNPLIQGFTTNPSLLAKAGITDYGEFAMEACEVIGDRPISFEVIADDLAGMEQQGLILSSWGENVYVKIPVTTTNGTSTAPVVESLLANNVKVNITAITTIEQVEHLLPYVQYSTPKVFSIMAGRIADSGRDPVPYMRRIRGLLDSLINTELLWASPRELYNLFQANEVNCEIITLSDGLLSKIPQVGRPLEDFSLNAVKTFYLDASKAGLSIPATNDTVVVEDNMVFPTVPLDG